MYEYRYQIMLLHVSRIDSSIRHSPHNGIGMYIQCTFALLTFQASWIQALALWQAYASNTLLTSKMSFWLHVSALLAPRSKQKITLIMNYVGYKHNFNKHHVMCSHFPELTSQRLLIVPYSAHYRTLTFLTELADGFGFSTTGNDHLPSHYAWSKRCTDDYVALMDYMWLNM